MGLLNALTGWLKKEVQDVKQAVDGLEDKLDLDLARRERVLTATPEEQMAAIADEQQGDELLADVQAKLDAKSSRAAAEHELIEPVTTDSGDASSTETDHDGNQTDQP